MVPDLIDGKGPVGARENTLIWQLRKARHSEARQVLMRMDQILNGKYINLFWRRWTHELTAFLEVPLSHVLPFGLRHTKDQDSSTCSLGEHIRLHGAFQRSNSWKGCPCPALKGSESGSAYDLFLKPWPVLVCLCFSRGCFQCGCWGVGYREGEAFAGHAC